MLLETPNQHYPLGEDVIGHSVAFFFFFFQAEDGIRDTSVTGVQTCALPIFYPVQIRETHFLQDKQLIPDVAANFEDVRAPRYTLQEAPIQCSSGDPVISVVQCIEFCRGKSISVGIFPAEAARPLACLVCSLRGCNQSTLLYSAIS